MGSYTEEVGKRLMAARKHAGLTQNEIAIKLGLSNPQTYGHYERGRTALPPRLNKKIQEITGVNLDWLLHGTGQMLGPAYSQEEMELVGKINQLEEKEKELVESFVHTILQKKN